MKTKVPALTGALVLAALSARALPGLAALLVYDRAAVLQGEVWRLVSAPLVHFSPSHLVWNLLVLAAAGWMAEVEDRRALALVWGLTAVSSGLFALAAQPDLARYGGLSGLATAGVVYVALGRVLGRGEDRLWWLAILGLVVTKILWEQVFGVPLFAGPGDEPFRVLPAAHAAGLGAALFKRWRENGEAFMEDGPVRTTGVWPAQRGVAGGELRRGHRCRETLGVLSE